LGKIPIKPLEGVLISEKDIDWYKFTFTTPDSQFVKFIPNTEKTSEYFGIVIGLFDTSKHPKGIIYYYQGPPSDAVTKFSWKLGSGDYFFYVKIDTSYVKKAGQYCFDITRQSKLPGRYSAITGI